VLATTDTSQRDVVVVTARLYHRDHSFSGVSSFETSEMFNDYEQELFTAVVSLAEKEGKSVSLLVAAGTDVFDTIMLTAQALQSSRIVCGVSNKLSHEEQAKLTGDAWERLPKPKPSLTLELVASDNVLHAYTLGAHMPTLRAEDLELLHHLWLDLTRDPEHSHIHHYDVVSVALRNLENKLALGSRDEIIGAIDKPSPSPPSR
jgi:hypothetical protein